MLAALRIDSFRLSPIAHLVQPILILLTHLVTAGLRPHGSDWITVAAEAFAVSGSLDVDGRSFQFDFWSLKRHF